MTDPREVYARLSELNRKVGEAIDDPHGIVEVRGMRVTREDEFLLQQDAAIYGAVFTELDGETGISRRINPTKLSQ